MPDEKKDEPEATYIVCLTKKMGEWNPNSVAEGSEIRRCETCGTSVWIAQAGQKMKAERPDAQLICMPCVIKMQQAAEKKGEDVKVGIVPGAAEEALRNIARNEAKKNQ